MTTFVTQSLPPFEALLSDVIGTSSISSTLESWDESNRQVISLLADWFKTLGFEVDIYLVPDTTNKFNLLARLGSGEGGLLLAGHSDTVPFDEHQWQHDPHKINNLDGKFYGLGTCDMKSFFVFILEVIKQIKAQGQIKKLKKPLYVLATADEETTMAGARYFSEQQLIKPDAAIIGEPTELVPVIMHKGHMSHRITVTGQSGHSSKPDSGLNAIEVMVKVISSLQKLKTYFRQQFSNPHFSVPEPTLNFGAIKGGDSANRICGACHLDIDMRALPSVKNEELIFLLTEQLKPIVQQYPGRINIEELHMPCPSFETLSDNDQQKQSLGSVAQDMSGHKCCAVDYCTEAPFIQNLGVQTIVLGPGSINQAHQPNEYLCHQQIKPTLHVIEQLIKHYCF